MRGPIKATLFAEGRVGEDNFQGVWGGLKVYFGRKDKSLIRCYREDDPIDWTPEALGTLVNSATSSSTTTLVPIAPLPNPECCIDFRRQ